MLPRCDAAYANTSVSKLKTEGCRCSAAAAAAAAGVHFLLCRNQALNYTTLHTSTKHSHYSFYPLPAPAALGCRPPRAGRHPPAAYNKSWNSPHPLSYSPHLPSPSPLAATTGFIFIYKKGCDSDSVEIAKNQKQQQQQRRRRQWLRQQQHVETK